MSDFFPANQVTFMASAQGRIEAHQVLLLPTAILRSKSPSPALLRIAGRHGETSRLGNEHAKATDPQQ